MFIVYILISKKYPERCYIGFTENLENRLKEHNDFKSHYSSKYGPWELQTFITFKDKKKAKSFEEYLKQGSGFAFLKKRLI
ncbi:MAG: GIY-YIG nuclease family protein [Candidatus Omnitrophota bacterium]